MYLKTIPSLFKQLQIFQSLILKKLKLGLSNLISNENILFIEGGTLNLKWENLLRKIWSDPSKFVFEEQGWRAFCDDQEHGYDTTSLSDDSVYDENEETVDESDDSEMNESDLVEEDEDLDENELIDSDEDLDLCSEVNSISI